MRRLASLALLVLCCATAQGHHWVSDVYDAQKRITVAVEVRDFQLIYPHPLMLVKITAIPGAQVIDGIEVGQIWTLEMDNKRELTELGFHEQTFMPGDQLVVVVDPIRQTSYRKNTLYMRAVEHQREGFVYVHNVRQLFPVDSTGDSLSKHIGKAH